MTVTGIAADNLRSFIERIERLDVEKRDLAADIKEVYAEAKSTGFDTATMRKIIRLRSIDDATRREEAMVLETYMIALGMLGEGAMAREAAASVPAGASAEVH